MKIIHFHEMATGVHYVHTGCGLYLLEKRVSRLVEDVTCKRCKKSIPYLDSLIRVVQNRLRGKK